MILKMYSDEQKFDKQNMFNTSRVQILSVAIVCYILTSAMLSYCTAAGVHDINLLNKHQTHHKRSSFCFK